MQFVDVVGQQVRPLQALPAPNRIIHVKRHVPPAAWPQPGGREHRSCRQANSRGQQTRTVVPATPGELGLEPEL